MRISMPPEHQAEAFQRLFEYFPSQTVQASQHLQVAIYHCNRLSLREYEAARARTAQINGCLVCQSFRAWRDLVSDNGSLRTPGGERIAQSGTAPDEAFYENLENWRAYPAYSERERLAVAYAEGLGLSPHLIAQDEQFWTSAKAVFDDDEIVELSLCIAGWMGQGRVAHALGFDLQCAAPV